MRLTLSALSEQLRAAVALIVVAVLAATVVIVLAVRHRPVPVSAPLRPELTGLVTPSASAAAVVTVDVEGKVQRPGLVELPPGSRVSDAIRAAGGLRPGAQLSGLNLARKVIDGEQLVVGEPVPAGANAGAAASGANGGGSGAAGSGAGSASAGAAGAPVNLNTASLAQLDTLPGVGPVMAQRILDWRTAHGGFTAVDQLREIEGIGDKTFDRLKDLVVV